PDGPIRRTLVERVEGAGAVVQATADGVQALEIVRVSPPQLAFVGPQIKGIAALDLCRAPANKGIAGGFLGSDGGARDDALKAGAVEYLELPSFVNEAGVVGKLLTAREKDPGSGDWFVNAKLSDFGCPALVRALVAVGRSAVLTLERGDRSGELRFYE